MKHLLLSTGLAALLALTAPASAEPVTNGYVDRPRSPRLPEASDRWFFGDGGFGCPLWWCGDAGPGLDRPRQAEASERWFFGDGGLGCPFWWCGDAALGLDRPRQADPSERWFFGDGGLGCPAWQCRAGSGAGGQPGGD